MNFINSALLTGMLDNGMSFGERISMGLQVLLFGMAVIFSVLMTLWGILVLFRVVFYDIPNKKKTPSPAHAEPAEPIAPAEPVAVSEPVAETDESELVAAITAAIAMTLDKPQTAFRVVSFRRTASK